MDDDLKSMTDRLSSIDDENLDSYFKNMEIKQLMQQVQGALNEHAEIIKQRVLEEKDIQIFCEEVLGYQLEPHHLAILKSQQAVGESEKQLTLAFRGCGKSTIGTVARICFEIVKNPNLRILLVSNTQIQAEIFAREIKDHFEANQDLINIFGNFVGKKWDAKEIIVAPRTKNWKESTLSCIGVGGPTASRHYDLVVCDDIVDEENSRTSAQREKLRIWFYKALIPTLEPHARLFISGTCYNPGDIYSVLRIEDGIQLCIVPAINEDGESSWPDKFSIDYLLRIRSEMGIPIFETQFQMNCDAMEGKIFSFDSFVFYDELPAAHIIYQGCDLAIGQKDGNDYFAHATIAVDQKGLAYVVDIFQDRLTFKKQTSTIVKKVFVHDALKVGIESNAYQAAQLQEVQEHIGKKRAIPIFTLKDKTTRGMKLAAVCENGRLLFKKGDSKQMDLIEQLIKMPSGDHDDMFDALDIAYTTYAKGTKRKREHEPGVI